MRLTIAERFRFLRGPVLAYRSGGRARYLGWWRRLRLALGRGVCVPPPKFLSSADLASFVVERRECMAQYAGISSVVRGDKGTS